MSELAITLLDACNYALILLLVALGLAIIFGLMNVINLAHGEFLMLGGYVLLAVKMAGGSFWAGLVLAPVVVGVVGLVVEELVIRRIYSRVVDTILATWGISLLIKQLIVIGFGPGSYAVEAPFSTAVPILGTSYPSYRLFIMAVSICCVTATFLFFFKTRTGLAARGVIANRTMAACLGVNTRRLDRLTFAFGAGLAGLAGAVISPLISLDPQMGLGFLVPAFLAILVGGLGTITGPVAGASGVGLADNLTATFLSPVWAQLVVFVLAIIVIRLAPSGLLARKRRKT
ncbi:branched-chain amino acid ABC transporter permease [Labrenzia sp. 011]|uniref:branched-chain amino acid ABC transporter permease n=1 Tax=Labrenzia sp. 011 TaxID=2171494 RepID=UPI000D52055A|nr:branched-chain amino acid ABC transporter permease [Labrenzia sp. 011]PVB60133.1 branched-chain amino acid ABC transporter permease [Labrenzia sp. 011]